MTTSYTSHEFGQELGMTSYPAIIAAMKRFDEQGWLPPSVNKRTGSGNKEALYSEEDLRVARIVLDVVPIVAYEGRNKAIKAKRIRTADIVRRHLRAKFIAFTDEHVYVGDDVTTLWKFAKDLGVVTVICMESYR